MSVRILRDQRDGMAVLYDSVSEVCFGPIIRDYESDDGREAFAGEVAEAFLEWLGEDPRRMLAVDVVTEYGNFMAEIERDGWKVVTEDEGRIVAVREDGTYRVEEDSDRKYDLAKERGEL